MSAPPRDPAQLAALVVDLSAIYWSAWHGTADQEVSEARLRTVAAVRRVACDHDLVLLALDAPRSKTWRRARLPAYKANRTEHSATGVEEFRRTIGELTEEYPALRVPTYEADDIIAGAVQWLRPRVMAVGILGADKDLHQLVADGIDGHAVVSVLGVDGEVRTHLDVVTRWGCQPEQIPMIQALAGDRVDGLPGIPRVGPKRAVAIMDAVGWSWEVLLDAVRVGRGDGALRYTLGATPDDLELWLELTTLTPPDPAPDYAAIIFGRSTITTDESELPMTHFSADPNNPFADLDDEIPDDEIPDEPPSDWTPRVVASPSPPPPARDTKPSSVAAPTPRPEDRPPPSPSPSSAPRERDPNSFRAALVRPGSDEWEASEEAASGGDFSRALEPRSLEQAATLSKWAHQSRLFSSYGRAEGVLMTILAGREMGIPAMASLRGIHIVEGRPQLSAQLMMALCLRHPECKLFRVVRSECSADRAVVEVQRRGWAEPDRYTWTREDAELAGLGRKPSSNHARYPRQMLINRAIAEAARFAFPDVCGGMYTPEEMSEVAR